MLHKWQSSEPTSLPHCFQTGTLFWTWYQLEICQLNLTGLLICDFKPFDREEEECLMNSSRSRHALLKLGLCWTLSLVWLKSWRVVGCVTCGFPKGRTTFKRGNFWQPETASQALPILPHDSSIICLWGLDPSALLGAGFREGGKDSNPDREYWSWKNSSSPCGFWDRH